MGSCLCSTVPTSVVAASAVSVLDFFTLGVEVGAFPVWWDGVLGVHERLRGGWGWGLLRHRGDGRVGGEEKRGR